MTQEIEALKKENLKLRELLWTSHGHQGLYGDDGEMQCGMCPLDFKRDPVNRIEAIFAKRALENYIEALKKKAGEHP